VVSRAGIPAAQPPVGCPPERGEHRCAGRRHGGRRPAAGRVGPGRWVDALPAGLGTAGSELSAGERQLVALIRVALVDTRVLLLDEATSDVDPATAELVEQAIERLAPGRTVIVVAHRAQTLDRLDEVLHLHGGRLRAGPG